MKTSVITLLIVFLSFLSLKNFNRIEDCYSFSGGSLHFFTMKLLRGISFLTLLGKSFWALTWSVTIKDYKKLIAIYIIDVDIWCSNDRAVDRKNPKQNVPRNQNYISCIVKNFCYLSFFNKFYFPFWWKCGEWSLAILAVHLSSHAGMLMRRPTSYTRGGILETVLWYCSELARDM